MMSIGPPGKRSVDTKNKKTHATVQRISSDASQSMALGPTAPVLELHDGILALSFKSSRRPARAKRSWLDLLAAFVWVYRGMRGNEGY